MTKSNIFFADDPARLFLPWISMLMAFIAVLVLEAGMTTYGAVTRWQTAVSGTLTVQIPTYTDQGVSREDSIEKDLETALTIIRSSYGIKGATVLSDQQMTNLMAPWLGENIVINDLPLPKLIDITLDPDYQPDLAQLKADLASQVPEAILDSHRVYLTPLLRLASGIIKLVGFVLVLLILTVTFTVIYATRTSLSVHEHVISLVHMMGAGDLYVTQQYAGHSFKLTLMGGLLGFLLALPIMAGISFFIQGSSFESMFRPSLSLTQWGVLLSVPLFLSILAFITTFRTVLRFLRRFL